MSIPASHRSASGPRKAVESDRSSSSGVAASLAKRRRRPSFSVAVLLFASATVSASALEYENLLQGLPSGFETGHSFKRDGLTMIEMVPVGESVQDWSEMVTTQIFHNNPMSLDDYFGDMQRAWSNACKNAEAIAIRNGEENGYPFAVWLFSCPENPLTGKPENTWMKGIRANDAFYAVQWAFRSAPTEEEVTRSVRYLRSVLVCDSRLEQSPCPRMAEPAAADAGAGN